MYDNFILALPILNSKYQYHIQEIIFTQLCDLSLFNYWPFP